MPFFRAVRNAGFYQIAVTPVILNQIIVRTFDAQLFQLVQRDVTVNHTVYQPHDLGTADRLIRPETAVRVALYPASVCGCIDIAVRPMAVGNVVKEIAALVVQIGEPRRHDGKLRAGDGRIRREFVFIRAVYNSNVIQRFDFFVEPVIRLDVLERAV